MPNYTVKRYVGDTVIDTYTIDRPSKYAAARAALKGQGYTLDQKRWCDERHATTWTLTGTGGWPEGSVTVN